MGDGVRRSWYWQDYSDDDLLHLAKSHQALIDNSLYEIKRIEYEISERKLYDETDGSGKTST